jgi:phage baseplate assembly protein W
MKTVSVISAVASKIFDSSIDESFTRITTTPLTSRTLRNKFGSKMHKLIDKVMDEEWRLLFRKYLFECFFDDNNNPWDERLNPKSVEIVSVDVPTGSVTASINFEDFDITTQMGGF